MESLGAHGRESKAAATSHAKAVVFVVDDDISVRESLQMLIQNAGWRPVLFGSAQEFLAQPRVITPSCLILDVSLPGLNGFDLQRRVADRIDMPIIFITGHGDVPMSVRAMKAGAAEFLTKPFTDESLLEAITHAIARSQAVVTINDNDAASVVSIGNAEPSRMRDAMSANSAVLAASGRPGRSMMPSL